MQEWIACPKPRADAIVRLFCFPYAGGGIAAFRNWGEDLGPDVEVCCIQLPGREHRWRERPVASMSELVSQVAAALRRLADRPYALYGHSLGARIAFEVARELRRTGDIQPSHLFVGACPAPQVTSKWPPLRWLQDDDFLDEIQRRYGGVPKQILAEPEIRAALLPALRADVTLMETYSHDIDGPLDCSITAVGGASDKMVPRAALDAWRDQTRYDFELHLVNGDHFFLQSQSRSLLSMISAKLAHLPKRKAPFEARSSR